MVRWQGSIWHQRGKTEIWRPNPNTKDTIYCVNQNIKSYKSSRISTMCKTKFTDMHNHSNNTSIHPFSSTYPAGAYLHIIGRRWGTLCTSRQFFTGLTYRDKQPSTLTFIPMDLNPRPSCCEATALTTAQPQLNNIC